MSTHEAVYEAPEYEVEVLGTVTDQDVQDWMRLQPQLSSKELPPEDVVRGRLEAAANPENPDSRVVVIRDEEGHIQACATAGILRIPTGEKPWIDDVVTDADHRGLGYGRACMEALHEWLAERGVESVNLTSKPSRGAAGNLYESMGYEERSTRVYRKSLGGLAVSEGPITR